MSLTVQSRFDKLTCVSRPSPARRQLERLLDRRNEHPEQLATIDAQIEAQFERKLAIFVLDMCGFSRLTVRHGIIHYLAMIRRMQRAVLPCLEAQGGVLLKAEADNLFATFEKVPAALRAALSIQRELARENAVLPEDWDVHVSIGIGYGKLLVIGQDDLYGSEMNLASKLGEDVAKAGEVLLTEAAFLQAGARAKAMVKRRARLGGLTFPYYQATPAPRPAKRPR